MQRPRHLHSWVDVLTLAVIVAALLHVGAGYETSGELKVQMLGAKWAQLAMSQLAAKLLILFGREFQSETEGALNRAVAIRIAFAVAVAFAG